jgi:hypothetical protein
VGVVAGAKQTALARTISSCHLADGEVTAGAAVISPLASMSVLTALLLMGNLALRVATAYSAQCNQQLPKIRDIKQTALANPQQQSPETQQWVWGSSLV